MIPVSFLPLPAAVLCLGVFLPCGLCVAAPDPSQPRATSGDDRAVVEWKSELTITVGPPGSSADIQGSDEKCLQAAVDSVARLGGGTVKLLPGTWKLRNAVHLQSKIRISGSGAQTVLIKEASAASALAADSDWYDQEITLTHPDRFRIGDGICLRAGSARFAIKRTLTAQNGSRFRLDRPLRENVWLSASGREASAASLFPLISAENCRHLVIEDMVLDGNRAQNDELDGNYAGCVWMQDCSQVRMQRLEARNYHGDGLSWQICHDVEVLDCWSHGHSGLALHPGSGSQRSVIRGCKLEDCDIGIFFCWGVRFGRAEGNFLRANRIGISLGHRDTDNVIVGNEISASRETGLLFRPEKDAAAAGHRNRIERNRFLDNGGEDGAAVTFAAPARDVILRDNIMRESRGTAGRVGIRIKDAQASFEESGNKAEGMPLRQ
jgi:hypothetical protein